VSGRYKHTLDGRDTVRLSVRWRTQRRDVVDYAVALIVFESGVWETIRVYDGAHGINELHRYTRSRGKQVGTVFHAGTLAEGLAAAQLEIKRGWAEMIEGWRR
jgi:hypothetical protein